MPTVLQEIFKYKKKTFRKHLLCQLEKWKINVYVNAASSPIGTGYELGSIMLLGCCERKSWSYYCFPTSCWMLLLDSRVWYNICTSGTNFLELNWYFMHQLIIRKIKLVTRFFFSKLKYWRTCFPSKLELMTGDFPLS